MNRTTLMTLMSIVAASSITPSLALAERDNGFSRDRQENQRIEHNRNEQRDSRRDANRTQTERATPQRPDRPATLRSDRRETVQQRSAPRIETRTQPKWADSREHRSEGKPATIEHRRSFETERRGIEPKRSYEPERRRVETRPAESRHTGTRHVETRRYRVEPGHEYREHYVYHPVARDRYYFGIHIYRHYGHRYPGFGFYYSDHDALRFLAFTALTLTIIDHVDEHAQRLHEQAMIRATSADVGDTVYWDEGKSYGSVTVNDIWYDRRGRECRELEQRVTDHGLTESKLSTVCKKPDGIWVVPAH